MAERESAATRVCRYVDGAIGRWIGLGRGWQAVLLGSGIVVACELLA